MPADKAIEVQNVTIGYGDRVLMQNISFSVGKGEIMCILGGSGCGKSTLLKHIIGLYSPQAGDILIDGRSIVNAGEEGKRSIMREFGVTYQGGALFGSMTVAENVALPLEEYTDYSSSKIAEVVEEKLKLVDLGGFGTYMPSELSGGMKKRAGLARALALDPHLLFFDEPSAGLDPITSADLDRLILRLRDNFGSTIVVVTHELDSIFTIADRVVMLDKATKSIIAAGNPRQLLNDSPNRWVRSFLGRDGLKSSDETDFQVKKVD
ncbi:MAG: ATP-binding cassette domain-containing protein [Victivallaceae bacterium]|nr:ATP-binding cassette domain-containing protein [Victivallaceae bacterium]